MGMLLFLEALLQNNLNQAVNRKIRWRTFHTNKVQPSFTTGEMRSLYVILRGRAKEDRITCMYVLRLAMN